MSIQLPCSHTLDGPAKSESLVDRWNHQLIDGKHPMIYRVSTCFNHPFGGAGFRWPIHSMFTTFRPSDGARPHPTATSWSCHAPFWWPHPSRHWPSATKGGGKLGPESYWRWGKNPCQWIGLRENLNRRPSIFHDFPMKYGAFRLRFSLKPIHWPMSVS